MKTLIYTILGVVLISTLSCTKYKDCCTLPIPAAKLTAERNNALYQTPDVHGTISGDSITFTYAGHLAANSSTMTLDSLFIRLKYNGVGTYSLANANAAYFVITSTAVPVPPNSPTVRYQLNSTYNNSLNITSYDQSSGKISATFDMEFVDAAADKVNLLNGNFYLPVNK